MDGKYLIGIPEIDAQHKEICKMVAALQEAIASHDQPHLLYPALKRLHHLLTMHFSYEEEMMRMLNYPNIEKHLKAHKKVLQLLKTYFDHPLAPGDHDHFGKILHEKVLSHVMEHDTQLSDMARDYLKPGSIQGAKKPAR